MKMMPPDPSPILSPDRFHRDRSYLGQWWYGLDRWSLAAICLLAVSGLLLLLAASPPVAERLKLTQFHFFKQQLIYLPVALSGMIFMSFQSVITVRRIGLILFLAAFILTIVTLFSGMQIKGANRWIYLFGFSLQPSEFLKTGFIILTAWLFSAKIKDPNFPGIRIACFFLGAVLLILLLQPDLGMAFLVTLVWSIQLFIAGLPMALVIILVFLGVIVLIGAYMLLPHVRYRIDLFFDPTSGDSFQIDRSMAAFDKGGFWGTGPGEGIVKYTLPDAHADFIFAVAAEELGLLFCLFMIGLYAFIVIRGMLALQKYRDVFVIYAVIGLLSQFGLQAAVNLGSTLQLIPAKGMTLPLISYGGSSLLATCFGLGCLLALTHRRTYETRDISAETGLATLGKGDFR